MMPRGIFFASAALLLGIFIIGIEGREISKVKHDKVVVCYMAGWAAWRPAKGLFQFSNLQPHHCTHIIYAFAGLNVTTSKIRSLDAYLDLEEDYGKGTYKKMTGLHKTHPGLKVSIAIGGWTEGSANYSALAASPERRRIFVDSVVDFLKTYDFDGLDLDWEFPAARGGAPHDKENFSQLIRELSAALKNRGLLLTAAISADRKTINAAYEIPEISKYLDFIHVMAYDYHGAWDKQVLPNAPLHCNDDLCVVSSIEHLLKLGAPADKLVLGLPMYGRTFILTTMPTNGSIESPIGAPALDYGFKGNFTRENGFLGYNEICKELVDNAGNWRTGWYEPGNSAYSISGDKVVVYDTAKSLMKKSEYVLEMKLAGVMIWSIDTDDFRGDCFHLHHQILDPLQQDHSYPLMQSINMALAKTAANNIDDNTIEGSSSSASSSTSLAFLTTFLIILASSYFHL